MRKAWKSALFIVLNVLLLLILVGLVLVHMAVYQSESAEGAIMLLVFIPADIAFVVIATVLFILGESFHISILNKLLPILAMVAFTFPALAVEYKTASLFGIYAGIALGLLVIIMTVRNLLRRREKSSDSALQA